MVTVKVLDPALLPCPLCGEPAQFDQWSSDADSPAEKAGKWSAGCTAEHRCGCNMFAAFDSKADAAEAWNKRHTTPEPTP